MTTLESQLKVRGLVLVLAALTAIAGCAEKKRTEVILGLATDLDAPTPLRSVHLQVVRLPEIVEVGKQDWTITGESNKPYELPGSFAVYSADGSPDRVRVVLDATDDVGMPLVRRTAVLTLVPEKTLFVRLGMVSACVGVPDCAQGLTCVDGRCVSEEIDSSRLPDYKPGVEKEVACSGSTTFVNTSTGLPLAATGTLCTTGGPCQEGVCLVPPPAGSVDAGTGDGGAPDAGTGGARGTGGSGAAGGNDGGAGSGGSGGRGTGGATDAGIDVRPDGSATGGSGTGTGGAPPGTGGSAGVGVGGVSGTILVPDATGFVSAAANGFGIQGPWYVNGDHYGPTGSPPGDCETLGMHPGSACSVISAPPLPPGTAGFPNANGKMCTSGTAARVVNGPGGLPDYAGIWGARLVLALNNSGGTNPVSGSYNATAHNVAGIEFDIDVPQLAGMRVEFPTTATASAPAYWNGAISNVSPVLAGHNQIRWTAVTGPMYVANPPVFDPTTILAVQFTVTTNTSQAVAFNYCISNLGVLPLIP